MAAGPVGVSRTPSVTGTAGRAARWRGSSVSSGPASYEMCTPTGAALLAAARGSWGSLPPMRVTAQGSGAGARDVAEVPNALRVVLGDPVAVEAGAGEAGAPSCSRPRRRPGPAAVAGNPAPAAVGRSVGGLLTPILMKKGRPTHTVLVLVEAVAAARRVVFTETSTIGLGEVRVGKHALGRRTTMVTGSHASMGLAGIDLPRFGNVSGDCLLTTSVVEADVAGQNEYQCFRVTTHSRCRCCFSVGLSACRTRSRFPS